MGKFSENLVKIFRIKQELFFYGCKDFVLPNTSTESEGAVYLFHFVLFLLKKTELCSLVHLSM